MENHKLVMPEDLNHHGNLFGGKMLQWVDEYAWIAATLDYPHCHFVTIGMDKVEFKKGAKKGDILKFLIVKGVEGNTSVKYVVHVFDLNDEIVFCTTVTMVNVDENGSKRPLYEETYDDLTSGGLDDVRNLEDSCE